MSLIDISKLAETSEQFIRDLAEGFRKKRWVKILCLLGAISVVFFNSASVKYGLEFLGITTPISPWYNYVWIIFTILIFVSTFFIVLQTKVEEIIEPAHASSIIKGLLAYTSSDEDAKWFAKLQRGNILKECLQFCEGKDLFFGILSGESGTGKTSLLRAGLFPNLEKKNLHPVYVKLTDIDPIDSIRQSLNGSNDETSPKEYQNLTSFFCETLTKDSRPIILILDQFEQFFVHQKTKATRRHFIQQIAELFNERKTLPVTIFISVRRDYMDWLREFQSEMKYTLDLHNYLSIEKFQKEATRIFKVFAEEMKIEFDEEFVKEFTQFELADREDGTVSPIDIQILAWMLDGQSGSEERAFNRQAFQRLRGVEGLLERFLKRALQARETEARRQSAIQVMNALTEGKLRAGALTLNDIEKKLNGIISDTEIIEAVNWLSRSEVRLITPIQEKNRMLYEIAHERIIPPLQRLAIKEITGVSEAQNTLEYRVNEWIANSRSRQFLLNRRELKMINQYWSLINLDIKKEQKEEFVSVSRKYHRILRLGVVGIIFCIFFGIAGLRYYQYYSTKTETQIEYAKDQLKELLTKQNKTENLPADFFKILPFLNDNEEIKKIIWEKYRKASPSQKTELLKVLADSYVVTSKSKEEVANGFDVIEKEADSLDLIGKMSISRLLAKYYIEELSNSKKANDLMESVKNDENKHKIDVSIDESIVAASVYNKLSKIEEAANELGKVIDKLDKVDKEKIEKILKSIIQEYRKYQGNDDEITNGLRKILAAKGALSKIYPTRILNLIAETYSELSNKDKALAGLESVGQTVDKEFQYTKPEVYLSLIKQLNKIKRTDKAIIIADKLEHLDITPDQEKDVNYKKLEAKNDLFFKKLEAKILLSKTDDVLKFLDEEKKSNQSNLNYDSQQITDEQKKVLLLELFKENKSAERFEQITKFIETLNYDDSITYLLVSIIQNSVSLDEKGESVKILQKIEQISQSRNRDKSFIFLKLAEAYIDLKKNDLAKIILAKSDSLLLTYDEKIFKAKQYGRMEDSNEVTSNILDSVFEEIKDKNLDNSFNYLIPMANLYKKIDKKERMSKCLSEILNVIELSKRDIKKGRSDVPIGRFLETQSLEPPAIVLARAEMWKESREVINLFESDNEKIDTLSQISIIGYDILNDTHNWEKLYNINRSPDYQN